MLTHHDGNPRTPITPDIIRQDRIRRLKISMLQWRIDYTHERIKKCAGRSEHSDRLLLKMVDLIVRRNALYTEAETRQMAKERGLL